MTSATLLRVACQAARRKTRRLSQVAQGKPDRGKIGACSWPILCQSFPKRHLLSSDKRTTSMDVARVDILVHFGTVLIEITMPYRDQGACPTPMTWLVSAKEDISRLRQNEIGVWARSTLALLLIHTTQLNAVQCPRFQKTILRAERPLT